MTILRTLETDGVPAPSDIELAALDQRINWPGVDVTAGTRCGYAFYCQYRNVNHIRLYLWQWIEDHVDPPARGEPRIYTVARWDDLLMQYEHQRELDDARDERRTLLAARNAGHPR